MGEESTLASFRLVGCVGGGQRSKLRNVIHDGVRLPHGKEIADVGISEVCFCGNGMKLFGGLHVWEFVG